MGDTTEEREARPDMDTTEAREERVDTQLQSTHRATQFSNLLAILLHTAMEPTAVVDMQPTTAAREERVETVTMEEKEVKVVKVVKEDTTELATTELVTTDLVT